MRMFKKPYYQRTITELNAARKTNIFAGLFYSGLAMFFFVFSIVEIISYGLIFIFI